MLAACKSPENPSTPVPATVLITPCAFTLRTRWLSRSAINTSPNVFTAMPVGPFNRAASAGPPSPLKHVQSVPAKRFILPSVRILRTT